MKKIVLQKENGEVKEFNYSELFEEVASTHLCWNACANATPSKCKKVHDEVKQNIDEYDFITDGFQILDENNEIDRFHVSGCSNYEKEPRKKPLTADKVLYYNNMKRNIAMLYYDADSAEAAEEIQRQQIAKGLQKKPRSR